MEMFHTNNNNPINTHSSEIVEVDSNVRNNKVDFLGSDRGNLLWEGGGGKLENYEIKKPKINSVG